MKKISILALITSLFVSAIAVANEVNIFNARHYKALALNTLTSLATAKVETNIGAINVIIDIFFISFLIIII